MQKNLTDFYGLKILCCLVSLLQKCLVVISSITLYAVYRFFLISIQLVKNTKTVK